MAQHEPAESVDVSTDSSRLDLDLIHAFLRDSYWAKGRRRSVVERALRNSICFGAYAGGNQVGFARVITDRATFAYLADVFVLPAFRGRGIAKAIMRAVTTHPELQNLRVFLLRTRDAHGLYAQFGFRPVVEPEHMMAIVDPESDQRAT